MAGRYQGLHILDEKSDASKYFDNLAAGFGEPANINPAKVRPAKIMAIL